MAPENSFTPKKKMKGNERNVDINYNTWNTQNKSNTGPESAHLVLLISNLMVPSV